MDDLSKHDNNELEDIDNDLQDIDVNEGDETPADTDGEPKNTAEEVKERQKQAWLDNIRTGKKTLDDMPENLGWLKKEIQNEIPAKTDDLESKMKKILQEERDSEDFNILADDLGSADAEQVAQVKEEYESLIDAGMGKLKALITARRLVGLKDSQTILAEKRRKGMLLPPSGSKNRKTVINKNKMTEIEKRLSGGLPPGFSM
jgi:hypothetical protein